MNFYINQYSEEELREFAKRALYKNNWVDISAYQDLSENFIREFQDKLDWFYISAHQNLSENFIREFKNKINWDNISEFQNLSENFIQEFKNKINWIDLRRNTKIQVSDEFTIEFDEKLGYDNIWMINYQFHRILGPAILCNGERGYYYRGIILENISSDEEYFQWLKYKDF